jgi:hypothetical protein
MLEKHEEQSRVGVMDDGRWAMADYCSARVLGTLSVEFVRVRVNNARIMIRAIT